MSSVASIASGRSRNRRAISAGDLSRRSAFLRRSRPISSMHRPARRQASTSATGCRSARCMRTALVATRGTPADRAVRVTRSSRLSFGGEASERRSASHTCPGKAARHEARIGARSDAGRSGGSTMSTIPSAAARRSSARSTRFPVPPSPSPPLPPSSPSRLRSAPRFRFRAPPPARALPPSFPLVSSRDSRP